MRAEHAWAALLGTVAAYELLVPDGEQLLTHGADRLRLRHPAASAAVHVVVLATAIHLLGYRGRYDAYRALSPFRTTLQTRLGRLRTRPGPVTVHNHGPVAVVLP